ncbi:hypothetical protein TRIUR3_19759 [Triticum urartu]|uniref:mTERF domain-containing protein 1, mitochondrial n=1 Tax=Triticum urartu TaxID=4572 RepID=M8ANS2_TRIUA|nr:hypothetical protein TRIUR3_19759 [Triticum urartu]
MDVRELKKYHVPRRSNCLLRCNLDKVVKPNVAFLQECGLGACDIVKLCIPAERILTTNPEQVRAMVACAQRLGMPPGSGMFRYALQAVAFLTQEKITAKVEYLKNTFRWSDAEVALAVSRNPSVLRRSKESLQRKSDFLISVVGLEPAYISRISVFITFSLECRLRPRHYVVNFLKENGLLDRERSYYAICRMTDKAFTDKGILAVMFIENLAVFFIDVPMNALQTGATAAACSAISQAISDLPVRLINIAPNVHLTLSVAYIV